jgi:hypothetical protein
VKINEVLTEAGVIDTIKAIAKQPGLLSDPSKIEATANKLRNSRDLQQLAKSMKTMWVQLLDQQRDRIEAFGADGSLNDAQYKGLLTQFVEKNLLGGSKADNKMAADINQVVADRDDPNKFPETFEKMITKGLIYRITNDGSQQSQQQSQQNNTLAPRREQDVLDRFREAGIQAGDMASLKAALSTMKIEPIRTNDPATQSVLKAFGIPTA